MGTAVSDEFTAADPVVRDDRLNRMLYAQDASVYAELPAGVAFPRHREDIQALVRLSQMTGQPLIPRGGGTSLAGQCVGDGIVVDVGRHMNEILELNVEEKWVRVQPGVILDDLNRFLAPHGLFFGPDTSTSNRCMIGGMVGNDSCGSHSIKFGITRDHVLELGTVFSDGTYERLRPWSVEELDEQCERDDVLGVGLRELRAIVDEHRDAIVEAYPPKEIIRRNTGYALDDIAFREPFGDDGLFHLPRFLSGSEGTLAFTTEVKLNLVDAPTKKLLVCAHFDDLMEALNATVTAVGHDPAAVELMDRPILERTAQNIEQRENRFFVEGDPDAILVVEFYRDTDEELEEAAEALIASFEEQDLGYSFPIVRPPEDKKVWELRKAGLGLLMGEPGDTKAVSIIEDTAVPVRKLPAYVADMQRLMKTYDTETVYYAHASVGELHIRPKLNIKTKEGIEKFEGIGRDVAKLVREYDGSLSGEHGDGRVRAPFIEEFYGEEVYELHRRVKAAFDPENIFNPGKIVDPEPIDTDLRFEPGREVPEVETVFDWSSDLGLVRAVEKCNGAGACRKPAEAGGTMCPSYMVTKDEKDTTRGRANVFRNLLLDGPDTAMTDPVLYEAMDLCLSCKGCKRECPANVDMARLKAEFLQHYWDENGTPLSALFFGYYGLASRLASIAPGLANFFMTFALTRWIINTLGDIAPERQLPAYAKQRFHTWWRSRKTPSLDGDDSDIVWLYIDPFTEYTEPEIAIAAVEVLEGCGRRVELFDVDDDGRTFLSKGLVRQAKKLTNRHLRNVRGALRSHPDRPVIGLEPSALLSFRDEWSDLADDDLKEAAGSLAGRSVLLDEYLARELDADRLDVEWNGGRRVLFHGHCHQKAIVGTEPTEKILEAAGYEVVTLQTGCCGMAGSFGYEKKHYDLSMKVGELALFPALRDEPKDTLVCAPGTSCRHQIADGVDRTAVHPAILLRDALAAD